METAKIFSCIYCNYTSNRKFNLKTHEINKHSKEILEEGKNKKNDVIIESIKLNEKNDASTETTEINDTTNDAKYNYCSKCYKKYLTIKSLKNHEEKCIGIDSLTCPKCMVSFTDRSNKSRHIKRNNCIAKKYCIRNKS